MHLVVSTDDGAAGRGFGLYRLGEFSPLIMVGAITTPAVTSACELNEAVNKSIFKCELIGPANGQAPDELKGPGAAALAAAAAVAPWPLDCRPATFSVRQGSLYRRGRRLSITACEYMT